MSAAAPAAAGTAQEAGARFLPEMAAAFRSLENEEDISTRDFAAATARILPVFDHLGTVFSFAKAEMETKRDTLVAVQDRLPTLKEVVAEDLKNGRVTVKNSCARNLYRLMSTVTFISLLLQNLAKDASTSLRLAATEAYNASLADIHAFIMKAAIRTSLYLLPDRETFIRSIGETEASARDISHAFIPSVEKMVKRIDALYAGTAMPRSDVTSLKAAPKPA